MVANAQVWDGTAKAWTKGSGTEADPYLIETGENLAYMAETVTDGETYEGVFFKLVNSLDMGGGLHKFSPIGFFNEYADLENPGQMIDESKYFLGVFDGNGKTVDNVHIFYRRPKQRRRHRTLCLYIKKCRSEESYNRQKFGC